MKIYVVLFQYSPNGRVDKGEFSAAVSEGRFFPTRESACSYVKSRYEERMKDERTAGGAWDEEWAAQLDEDDFKSIGYSWSPDFSRFGYERESDMPDVQPEPKYSWTVMELEGDLPEKEN